MKHAKIALCLLIALLVLLGCTACGRSEAPAPGESSRPAAETPAETTSETSAAAPTTEDREEDELPIITNLGPAEGEASSLHHVQIKIRDYGTVTLELDADAAPLTVQNFLALAEDGFYDGLTFHRIMDGFMIQGGDPLGNGTGGSDEKIKGEFAANGVQNDISHVKGVISMARATPYNSASSQFFIMVADYTGLDGNYAAFGHVTEGMEVAEKIAKDARPIDNNGTIPPEDQPVIESIVILD